WRYHGDTVSPQVAPCTSIQARVSRAAAFDVSSHRAGAVTSRSAGDGIDTCWRTVAVDPCGYWGCHGRAADFHRSLVDAASFKGCEHAVCLTPLAAPC